MILTDVQPEPSPALARLPSELPPRPMGPATTGAWFEWYAQSARIIEARCLAIGREMLANFADGKRHMPATPAAIEYLRGAMLADIFKLGAQDEITVELVLQPDPYVELHITVKPTQDAMRWLDPIAWRQQAMEVEREAMRQRLVASRAYYSPTLDSLRGAVLAVENVKSVEVTIDRLTRELEFVVEGGDDYAIGERLYEVVPAGVGTRGTTTVLVDGAYLSYFDGVYVSFSRPEKAPPIEELYDKLDLACGVPVGTTRAAIALADAAGPW